MSARGLLVQSRYVLRDAARAFRRNGLMSLAAVTILMVTLLVVAASVAAVANLEHLTAALESQVEIVAYLNPGLSAAQRDAAVAAARAAPGVTRVAFVSKEEALDRLQRSFAGSVAFRDLVETNPLPDSLDVRVARGEDIEPAARAIARVGGVDEVSYGVQAVDRLLVLTRTVRWLGAGGAAVLMAVGLIISVNTIRLTVIARRQEIEIMKLVGAGGWYVRMPLLIEGTMQGLVGAAAAAAVALAGYEVAVRRVRDVLPFLPMLGTGEVAAAVAGAAFGVGIAMGLAGSAIAVQRFLRAS